MRNTDQVSAEGEYLKKLAPPESSWVEMARVAAQKIGKLGISLGSHEIQIIKTFCSGKDISKIVEVGTLTGVTAMSLIEMASAKAEVWTFEKDPQHAAMARQIIQTHPGGERIHVIEGDAELEMAKIEAMAPFDLIFIDGNKSAYPKYLDWAERNIRQGGLIIADNVFLGGRIFDPSENKAQVSHMRLFNQRLADPSRYASAIIPTTEGLYLAQKLF